MELFGGNSDLCCEVRNDLLGVSVYLSFWGLVENFKQDEIKGITLRAETMSESPYFVIVSSIAVVRKVEHPFCFWGTSHTKFCYIKKLNILVAP